MVSRITQNSSAISSTWATTTYLTCEARGGEMCFKGAGSCQYTLPSCRLRNSQLLFERRPMYTKCMRYVSDKKTGLHIIQPHKMEADNVEWQVGYSLPILSSYISSTLMCTCLAPRPQKLSSIIISLVIERNCPRDVMMIMRPLLMFTQIRAAMGSSGLLAVCQVRFPVLGKQPCSASKCAGLSNKLQLPSPDLATVIDQKETLHCLHGLWMVVGDCHCNKGSTSWNTPSPSFAPSVLCQTMDMKVDRIVALR